MTSARFRAAVIPWAKDDLPDARILLDLMRQPHNNLRPLDWEEDGARKLFGLVPARRYAVDRRMQTLNPLTSLLKTYSPPIPCRLKPKLADINPGPSGAYG